LKLLLLGNSGAKIAYRNYWSPWGRKKLFRNSHYNILGGKQMKDSTWTYREVFPKIRKIIDRFYEQHQDFIEAYETSERLLKDRQAKEIIKRAKSRLKNRKSLKWFAGIMVGAFSKRITEAEDGKHALFPCQKGLERKTIKGDWAYRPVKKAIPRKKRKVR
jgi:hypothetical protein